MFQFRLYNRPTSCIYNCACRFLAVTFYYPCTLVELFQKISQCFLSSERFGEGNVMVNLNLARSRITQQACLCTYPCQIISAGLVKVDRPAHCWWHHFLDYDCTERSGTQVWTTTSFLTPQSGCTVTSYPKLLQLKLPAVVMDYNFKP